MKRAAYLLIVPVTLITIALSQPVALMAQETAFVEVAYAVMCQDVVDRQPIGLGDSFAVSVGKLWCFTKIVGAERPIEITHVWYFGDTERARVPLAVRSSSWRTYSSKRIQAHEIGDWHVDVIGPQGELFDSLRFKVTQY
jgi:hypothetical protein